MGPKTINCLSGTRYVLQLFACGSDWRIVFEPDWRASGSTCVLLYILRRIRKIKRKLTTLPRISIHVCQFDSIVVTIQCQLAFPSVPVVATARASPTGSHCYYSSIATFDTWCLLIQIRQLIGFYSTTQVITSRKKIKNKPSQIIEPRASCVCLEENNVRVHARWSTTAPKITGYLARCNATPIKRQLQSISLAMYAIKTNSDNECR